MPELLFEKQDIQLFWCAYDPLDLASDSIDPLGFMAGYISLADRLLPGLTTITTVPRYTSMLCHALKRAHERVSDGPIPSFRRRELVEAVKLFERAWALSCGLAELDPHIGEVAVDGLRGIRSVHRWLEAHPNAKKLTLSFALTSNQLRYAGFGAYGTLLEASHLADLTSLALRPLGARLADAFPAPDDSLLNLFKDGAKLDVDALREWGQQSHVGALSRGEASALRDALGGDEEAEFDDHTRWTMLRLIRSCMVDEEADENILLHECLRRLRRDESLPRNASPAANHRLLTAIEVIEPYEELYQCALFVFDQIRAATAENGSTPFSEVARLQEVSIACDAMGVAARKFIRTVEASAAGEEGIGAARESFLKTGIMAFSQAIEKQTNAHERCEEVLKRHARVQEGKFDGGVRKGVWVRIDGASRSAQLTQQRFGLAYSDIPASWRLVPRHPYRTFGATRFIRQCGIR